MQPHSVILSGVELKKQKMRNIDEGIKNDLNQVNELINILASKVQGIITELANEISGFKKEN